MLNILYLITIPIFFFISIVVLCFSCCFPSLYFLYSVLRNEKSPKSNFFQRITLGHRGAKKKEFPFTENTISAFEYCFNQGGDGIELDVNFTKDHQLAIFHDVQSTQRVMEQKRGRRSSTSQKIRDLSLHQVRTEFEYTKGKQDIVPVLSEVVTLVKHYNKTRRFQIMIELKEWRIVESILMAFDISDLFNQYPFLYDHSVVGSFNPLILFILRRINPKVVVNLLYYRNLFTHYATHYDKPDLSLFHLNYKKWSFLFTFLDLIYRSFFFSWLPSFIGAGFIGMGKKEALSESGARILKMFLNRGYGVNVWGVEKKATKQSLLNEGVAVTTDFTFD